MNEEHAHISDVLKYAVAGSFFGMVLVGAVLWFDISSIKSTFTAADNVLHANLFLSGYAQGSGAGRDGRHGDAGPGAGAYARHVADPCRRKTAGIGRPS